MLPVQHPETVKNRPLTTGHYFLRMSRNYRRKVLSFVMRYQTPATEII